MQLFHLLGAETFGTCKQGTRALVRGDHFALFVVGHGENAQREDLVDLRRVE